MKSFSIIGLEEMMGNPIGKRSDALRLGILGLGNAGKTAIRAALSSEFVQLAAVCDQSRTLAVELANEFGVPVYTNLRDLGRDRNVEVVYVSTPTFLHLPHALELASFGKHMMIEKPLVKDSSEADALIEIATQSEISAMAVNTRGRDAPIRAIARLVAGGAIGRVLSLTNLQYTNWVLRPRYRYELVSAMGGGVVFRQAPHQVEIAREILGGSVLAATARAGVSTVPVNTVGNYNALIEFEGGSSASLIFNGYGFFDSAELTYGLGEGGVTYDPLSTVRMRSLKAWNQDKYGNEQLTGARPRFAAASPRKVWSFVGLTLVSGEFGDIRQSPGGITVYDEYGPHEIPCLDEPGGLDVDFREFYQCVRFGEKLVHDAKWGAHTVKACEAIWKSHNEGRRVTLQDP